MNKRNIIFSLLTCLCFSGVQAQENVKKAIEGFITNKKVSVTKSISEERDITNPALPLNGKADVYTFSIKKKDKNLINDVVAAFEKDRNNPNVYLLLSHTGSKDTPRNGRRLLVGDSQENAIHIGMTAYDSYLLICLVDEADPQRAHRYAYAIEWDDNPQTIALAKRIKGKIVITYSRIPDELFTTTSQRQYNGYLTPIELSKDSIIGLQWENQELIRRKSELLMAFDSLYNSYLKGKDIEDFDVSSYGTALYSLVISLKSLLKDDVDLRKKMIADLERMISKTNKNDDVGANNIGYMRLAIKALK